MPKAKAVVAEPPPRRNRAQRRALVKAFASELSKMPKAAPVVNPTIVPKAKRRRRA